MAQAVNKALGPLRAVSASTLQLLYMFAFAAFVFLVGILVGSHVFDAQGSATDSAKPWMQHVYTQQKPSLRVPARLPPGLLIAASPLSRPAPDVVTTPELEPVPQTPEISIASLAATGPASYVDFSGRKSISFDSSLDSPQVSFGAWIYIDRKAVNSIRMIAANRHGGCVVDAVHRGWSFYVNNWDTSDRALVLEWRNAGGGAQGCARLSSEANTIPVDEWVHVGFALSSGTEPSEQQALLFLNGQLLRASTTSRAVEDVQSPKEVTLVIGASPNRDFFFEGRIAQVFVSKAVITPVQLQAAAQLLDYAGWTALADTAKAKMSALIYLASEAPPPAAAVGDGSDVALTELSSSMFVGELTGQVGVTSAPIGVNPHRFSGVIPPVVLPADVGSPPLKLGHEQPFKDAKNADKTPASILRGPLSGTLPAGALADFTSGGNQWVRHMIRVPATHASAARTDPAALALGTNSDEVTVEELAQSDETARPRAAAVVQAMRHAWSNYRTRAWGTDELKPRSGTGQDNWAGVGMTLVDSLDTLWLMGMETEFADAKEWVQNSLNFEKHASISVFEITIRELGGLLGAYDLSGDKLFLEKATVLADKLLPAFNTATGIPRSSVTLASGQTGSAGWTGGASILSELGTLQVEFRRLAQATGNGDYARKVEVIIEQLDALKPAGGLYPIYISADTGKATTSQVTFGALGDSFYEYLLKVWVQGGRKESMYRRMYDASMQGLTDKLLKRTSPSNLLFVADWDGGNTQNKMDHLVCFVPGMLALGAFTAVGTDGEKHAIRDLTNAKALMYTCWQMYERQATGISPEFVEFPAGQDIVVPDRAPFYILRPEAAESLFILHQLTGDPIYREWGWKMFQAIEKYCRVEFGYGAHPDVRDPSRVPDDRMESFFLAETLKYLYLLQSPDHPISLERYVFNTEAHPTRVFTEL